MRDMGVLGLLVVWAASPSALHGQEYGQGWAAADAARYINQISPLVYMLGTWAIAGVARIA